MPAKARSTEASTSWSASFESAGSRTSTTSSSGATAVLAPTSGIMLGVNTFRAGRLDELQSHPTVKPVALVADAIRDCSRRGDIVLDLFGGSGTTLLAAERVGRRAYTLEIEPRFVDVAIKRWQAFSGKDAICAESGLSFDDIASKRAMLPAAGPAPTDVR